MPCTPLRLLMMVLSFSAAPLPSQAQTAPPIKPGLWQIQSEREVNGQKAPDPMEQMKTLPPEARKQMETMMKKRGVDLGEGGGQKICHTRESLDQGRWKGDGERCKTDITSRSANAWKWRSVCTQPEFEMDGEAVFSNPENYTVKTLMNSQRQGKPQAMRMTVTAKWVGADCGDLKPMQPPAATK
jgi:hypothetical protein